jgi:hypothetical protein
MKWISSQPANTYYAWQVEVYLHNFIKNGINPEDIHVLFSIQNEEIPLQIKTIERAFPQVEFHYYKDTRDYVDYVPSIYFNAVKQHFAKFPSLETETIMFHDSDTILAKRPDFYELLNDNTWYFSDTKSYINYDYIMQKGEHILHKMCEIVGIDKKLPKLLNSNSGGAQHLIKNSTYEFWNKVENDAHTLYKYFCETEHLYVKKYQNDYPIQKWTAGMWSLLWNSWYFDNEVVISDKLSFGWATDLSNSLEGKQFLHNAGVTSDRLDLFFKGNWINTPPYNKNLQINEDYCSHRYYKEIQEVEKFSPLTNLYK